MCEVLGPKLNPNTVFLNFSGNIWGRVLSRPWLYYTYFISPGAYILFTCLFTDILSHTLYYIRYIFHKDEFSMNLNSINYIFHTIPIYFSSSLPLTFKIYSCLMFQIKGLKWMLFLYTSFISDS